MGNTKPTIRMIHQLPRAGGTLICKCLGAMNDITLLSEVCPYDGADSAKTVIFHKGKAPTISPLRSPDSPGVAVTNVYHPLYQACYWYRLVRPRELEALSRELDYIGIIKLIHQRASERGEALILRDWLYLNFWAKPLAPKPTLQLNLADALAQHFQVKQVFTVRHPLDQWLSWRSFSPDQQLDFETFMSGCRHFAEFAARHDFYRYEDFTRQPSNTLAGICKSLDVTYDQTYEYRWFNNGLVTGDIEPTRGTDKIAPLGRKAIDADTLRAANANRDYQATVALLGYSSL